jgi:phage terminase small subunit
MARRPPNDAKTSAPSTPLNDNQLAFLDRYLATFPRNGRQAYADVYGCKLSTAAVEASRLLKDPRIIAEIERRENPARGRFTLSADRIRREIAAIAHSDLRHYTIDAAGNVVPAEGAPADAMRAISRVKVKRKTIPQGKDKAGNVLEPIVEVEADLYLWDKPTALRIAAQIRGMLVKRAPVGPDGKAVPPIPDVIEVIYIESHDGKPAKPAKREKPRK